MPSLINRAAVKRLALEMSVRLRDSKFTRVSATFLNDVDAALCNLVTRRVHDHPSVGKTLQGTVTPVAPPDTNA